jgi:hypothetical protein
MSRLLVLLLLAAAGALLAGLALLLYVTPLQVIRGPAPDPGARVPSDLKAMSVHDRLAIQVFWTPVDQEQAVLVLQRSEDGPGGPWRDLATLPEGARSYLDQDGLRDRIVYSYRIAASGSGGGSGFSNVAGAVATDLTKPSPAP